MMYLSLIKLRSFIAVGENLSFRAASEQINLSQPAVSAHVRDLEQELGVPLLTRTTRSVNLTPEGENFMIRARRALDELEAVVLDLKDLAALRRGRVRVGCVPTIAATLLPEVLANFSRRYPDIQIEVVDEAADMLYKRMLNSEIDLAISPVPPRQIDLVFDSLFHDHYVAVFPKDHPLAGRKSVKMADFVRYPFVLLASPNTVRMVLEEAFSKVGRVLEPVYEAHNLYTIGGMVEAGLGITALPAMAVPVVAHSGLISVPISNPKVTREVGALRRHDQSLSPAAAEFLKTFTDVVNESS